jgi:hypothetical protein
MFLHIEGVKPVKNKAHRKKAILAPVKLITDNFCDSPQSL